ncbi:MAG TPA: DUF3860 domain-containing protein [Candidatus Thalassarchaeaceae archaeon]|jgi:hypothetical protein|nr:MAG TPA: DUF3860 domain-containing protein [Candidatus Poseidoniales archaeon]HII35452.1 DUF3860 domain-containing protein [Candidatus Thalassarchaeaceae archaeon]|tara:strand:+ start:135 stop:407 length:273 start_codon:yes stop_codon:yes gene_type:complete
MTSDNIRKMIRKFVSERPRNTAEIANWLEGRSEFGDTHNDISGVLESDRSIIRIGTIRRSGISGREYPLSEWATEEWVAHHEREKPVKEE